MTDVLCAHCLRRLGRWHNLRRRLRLCNPPEPTWLPELRRMLNDLPPPAPRQLRAHPLAWLALRRAHRPNFLVTPATLGDIFGVPVVVDSDLPERTWRFVNPTTGEVLHEGRTLPL